MGRRGPKATSRAQTIAETANYLSSAKRGLSAAERKEWDKAVRGKTPGFYREDDVQLLISYCRVITRRDEYDFGLTKAMKESNLETAEWFAKRLEKQIALLGSLCRMLQIGPSTRDTRRHAAKASEVGLAVKKSSRSGLMYGDPGEQAEKVLN